MFGEELRLNLYQDGVVHLRSFFAREELAHLRAAAIRCFEVIEKDGPLPGHYHFTSQAHSVVLKALLDFGIESDEAILAPLRADGLGAIFSDLMGGGWQCRLEHSWVRKKFAPRHAPPSGYALQDWHQDGALGAQFPPAPGPVIRTTTLATCWIPLDACGVDSPGLEFILRPQPVLLHFTELNDSALRQRFAAADFWAPALELGDALVFRNDVLHRTHTTTEMRHERMSIEYRIFPGNS